MRGGRGSCRIMPMSRPVLLLTDRDSVVARPARLHERVAARWRAPQLDSALAGGADPDGSALLALGARGLVGGSLRAGLARELRSIVMEARSGPHRMTRVEPPRRQVLAAAAELE